MFVHYNLLNGWTIRWAGVVTRAVFLVRVSRDGHGTSGIGICSHSNGVSEMVEVLRDTVQKEAEEVMHRNVKCFCKWLWEGHMDGERGVREVFYERFVVDQFIVEGETGVRGQ